MVFKKSILSNEFSASRNASLDLLRIVSMLMIIAWHCIVHGGILGSFSGEITVRYLSVILLMSFLSVHVNCFVLVSGYFLCESTFKVSKLIKLWLEALFWSAVIHISIHYFDPAHFTLDIRDIFRSAMPFTQDRYWFVTTYMLMYILSPICNKAITAMNKRQHMIAIVSFFTVFILLDGIVFWRQFTALNFDSVLYFVFLYFTASYFKLYPPKKRIWIIGYVICMILAVVYIIYLPELWMKLIEVERDIHPFVSYNSVLCVIGSVCFFLTFLQMKIQGVFAKLVTVIAPLTFGIYLIHEQCDMRYFIWGLLLQPSRYSESYWLIPIVIIMSLGVFIACACFEKVRITLFKLCKINFLTEFLGMKVQKLGGKLTTLAEKIF